MIIQIITTIFSLFALSRVLLRIIRDKASVLTFLFWGGFWSIVLIVVWFPNLIAKLSGIFGVDRGIDILVYLGILGLYYSTYRIYTFIQVKTTEVTNLVREIALIKKQLEESERESNPTN